MARVLITTDGSDHAEHAANEGMRLLGAGHEVVVLSVAPMPTMTGTAAITPTAEISLGPEALENLDEASEDLARERAEHTAGRLGVDARTMVVLGEPGATICDVAAEI